MRALRILLIVVVILGGLFVAADRAAVYFAESEAASKIKSSQGLSSEPDVSIKGFPFLTQVLSSSLDEIEISIGGITATTEGREVEVTEVRAELRDVRVNSSFSSATAGSAEGSALISYEDLTKSAPKGATVGYAGPERAAKGQVKVSGPLDELVEGAGIEVPDAFRGLLKENFTTYSTVSLEKGDKVRLRAEDLPKLPVPGVDEKLKEVVDYDLTIDGLPSTITLDQVTAAQDGLRFSGTGKDVDLTS
ncbi:hypothetical protein GCM10011583_58440 [Streptomyces camponoticapitis]|uniref:DUF2993 domain-containing protein n=1 Tax=Streptomyces camponoticapitis TaxID=1616125 RepID=A0ABQ2ERN2_9ACTN|nr:DUF2993 domain-containing protein [Streptomyces camponoticapitis]GGK18939.1 hypothetical protein GCM10011583_58440 [Streptomyces camponoticapitis]